MKKLLYFGLCICAVMVICLCFPFFSNVTAEEVVLTTKSINSATEFDDLFKSDVASGQKFVLTQDIILTSANTTFENRNIQNIEFDGQGHTIVTSFPLFNTVSNSSVIKNLNVIASKDFVYGVENSNVSSFGLVACDVQGSTVFNVSASCEIAPSTETTGYGVLDLSFNGSAYVGGMFGQLRYGAVVQNCYAQTNLKITQNDISANSTIVGGFVGKVDNATITNSYVIPVENELISITNNDIGLLFVVGGFAGQICDNVQGCVNVFTGGNLPVADPLNNKIVGKIFGEIGKITNQQTYLKISKCYSYNQSTMLNLYGTKNEQTQLDVDTIAVNNLKSISNFNCDAQINQQNVWDSNYEWDLIQTWCKKETVPEVSFDTLSAVEKWENKNYEFPVLQIFQDFTVTISKDSNSLGVNVSIVNDKDELLIDQKFSYGTNIKIKIEITDNYLPYKVIDSLKFNNQTYLQFNDDAQIKYVPITVSAETSGSYYASTKNISYYYINVKSENVNKGTVRYKNSTQNLAEKQNTRIEYGSSISFNAVESTVSYAFEKWVWLDENGEEVCDAILGSTFTGSNHLAQKSMTIMFGDTTKSADDSIYLALTKDSDDLVVNNSIPYKNVDGKIIFTLQANFSENLKELSVYVNSPSDACQVFISEVEVDGEYDSGMNFSQKVIVASYVKVKVELSDEYRFVGWSSLSDKYDINDLIDKKYSDAKSTEIYVKIQDATLLYAQVCAIEESKADLTWLWITLGGLGGAGLITLIVVLAVTKKRNESFVRYY